jgi:hypothetical protein
MAMREGWVPYREVFSSQGPLFLPLVWLADLVGLRTLDAPRLIAMASGIVIAGAVYMAGRAITDRAGAVLATALTTVSASVLWTTGPISSDGPALAFACVAVALVLCWRDDLNTGRGVIVGLTVGAAISVKALILAVIAPVAIVMLAGRRLAPIVAGAGAALAFHFALWLVWGPGDVWYQSYGYHLEVAGERTPGANLAKVLSTVGDRDLPVAIAAVLALIAGGVAMARHRARPLDLVDIALLAWFGGVVVVLALEHPLWRPHVSQLVPPLALLAARHRPPWPVLIVAGILVAPYHVIRGDDILWPSPPGAIEREVVARMSELPDGALAISDDPGLVWRAGRTTTPDLVDTSVLRMEVGDITEDSVTRVARSPSVCAVAVWSDRWRSFEGLPGSLEADGFELVVDDGPTRRLYVDPDCSPPG